MKNTAALILSPMLQPRARPVAVVALLSLIACGPVSLQQAEQQCAPRAYLAQSPQTSIGIQFNSDGTRQIGGSFGISTDFIAGRDPEQVFRDCVTQQSGQMPEHSYLDLPNSRP